MTPEEAIKIKSLTSRSDVFNHVIGHLRKQGTKSLSSVDKEMCAYRGEGGTMCAVGVLIADDEYDPSFEGNTVEHILGENLPTNSLNNRIQPNLEMLVDLQGFHDSDLQYEDGNFSMSSERIVAELRERWNIK